MSENDLSFRKENRLRKGSEFDRVFIKSEKIARFGLVVRFRKNLCSCSRLGMMIGKKSGNAVERNRIRRILRETFRLHQLIATVQYDILVTLYKTLKETDNQSISNRFVDILDGISLKKSKGTG